MPKIGTVEYDEAGFEHMKRLYAMAGGRLDGELDSDIIREAETTHEIYRQFPGTTMRDAVPEIATRAHARRSDPGTSHAAAASLSQETLRDNQRAVLDCFRTLGPMTHERLCEVYPTTHWGGHPPPEQSVSGLRTRTKELADVGLVRDTGRRTRLDSGRNAIVWEATA